MAGQAQDRLADVANTTKDRLADVASTVRDRAGVMKGTLADKLDDGADAIRSRTHGSSGSGGQLAAVGAGGGMAVITDGRLAEVGDRVAGGMNATADFLRDADLDNLKTSIERQVKEHPGRTLLIAAGLGYLIGKAFRK